MPAPATREEFLDVVRKSGVLDDESIATFASAAQDSGISLDEPVQAAQRMIRDGLLTSFQAKQFLQGKYRRLIVGGKYKLLEPLGAGGMGQVFLCRHIYMNRLVALKVLPIDKVKDPSMLERFYREARAAAALDHPNIVRAYDIDHDVGLDENNAKPLHYLVMEFVDGASLQELIARRGPMDPTRAAHYMRQAALGLEHAHEAGLVHRDIKPGNLLLDRTGTVKVLDLGLARFFDAGKDNVTERYDEKNAILGTADYLSPEQARGETVDIRADVYSLGATFYFLLTGKAPFEEGTITQKLLWSQTKAPKPILERRADVPAELIAVIDRMMAKDAKERYPTPAAVAEALAPFTQTPIEPPTADEMPRRSLAAITPGSPSQVLLPTTPSPRTVPSDLIRNRTASGTMAAVKPAGPKTPAPAGPMTPVPAGPRSKRLPAAERRPEPEPEPEFRPRRKKKAKGLPRWVVFAAAGVGGTLVVIGLLVGAIIKARKPHSPDGTTGPAIILADQAVNNIDRQITVELNPVRAIKDKAGNKFYLHSKAKNTDAGNLTITWDKKVMDQLVAKGIPTVESLKNKTVRVNGIVRVIQNRAQMVVDSADQIQLVSR
jgi:eukaryotic-like serine/threonine-protein kinase